MNTRQKSLITACAIAILSISFNTGSVLGVEIVPGQTYEGYTDAGEFASFYGGVAVTTSGHQEINNNTFSDNTNTHNGMMMMMPEGGGAIHNYNGTITIKSSFFNSNKSTGTMSAGGGAILLDRTKAGQITGTEFNSNTAISNGGAIYIRQAQNIEIANSEFTGNKVGQLTEYNKYGGAIMINGLSISENSGITYAIHDTVFEHNEASTGGAIYVGSSHVAFNNLTFNENKANSGGAMSVSSGANLGLGVNIYNSTFTGNTANDNGGAIDASGSLVVDNGTFTQNSANSGGAMVVSGDEPIFIRNSTFKENNAETLGGAVYARSPMLEIHDSKFENNHASTRGGAIATLANSSSSSTSDTVLIYNSDFINNKADQDGGAIHVNQKPDSSNLLKIESNDGKTHEFTGNMHRVGQDMGTPESNAIFIEKGKVDLITNTENNSKLLFNDGIAGSSIDNAKVNVGGDVIFNAQVKKVALTMDSGSMTLNGNSDLGDKPILDNVDLTLKSGFLDMKNDKVEVLNIRNFEMDPNSDIKIAFDVDLSKGESDKFDISQAMRGGMTFDAEHVDVNIINNGEQGFKLFNKIDEDFNLVGGEVVQFDGKSKTVLTMNSDGNVDVEFTDGSGSIYDAVKAEGVREFKLAPAEDVVLTKNLGDLKGEYLKINLGNKELKGEGFAGLTVAEDQRLELVNINSANNLRSTEDGGVVNNAGKLTVNNVTFKNNSSEKSGGAINNASTQEVKITDSSFINNKASVSGGAINNNGGNIVIIADKSDVMFSENIAADKANDIQMTNEGDNIATLTFTGSKSITLKGGINGEGVVKTQGNANVILAGDNSGFTGDVQYLGGKTQLLDNAQYYSAVNTTFANNAMLSVANNNANDRINLGNVNLVGNGRLGMDVDMQSGTSDKFAAETVSGNGKLTVDNINLIIDKNSTKESMAFNIIDTDENGNSPLFGKLDVNPDAAGDTLGAIFKYSAAYDSKTGQMILTGGGKHSKNYNPAVMAGPIGALSGAYLTQLNSYDMAFNNVDMYMLLPRNQRYVRKYANKYALSEGRGQYSSVQDSKSAWFKPYSTFENMRLKNGPRVSNVGYGAFFGGDSEIKELGHGFDGIFSVYAGYNGSHQAYQGNSIYQNGGHLGVTGVAYKGNFFTALTANVGANVGEASTMYGHDNFTMLMSGVAAKTGYNWEMADGKFILQPSYMMSYSFVNTFDYTNGAGVRIKSDPLNAIQITPGVKFIGNFGNGWQPYVGFSIVWNILDDTKFQANNYALPELSIKPYFNYGVGVQKNMGERFGGFLQAMFRAGGRNGVGLQFGFMYKL